MMKPRNSLRTLNTGVGNSVSYGGAKIPHKSAENRAQPATPVGNVTFNQIKYLRGTFPTFPTLSYAKSYAREAGVGNVGNLYKVSYVPTPRRSATSIAEWTR